MRELLLLLTLFICALTDMAVYRIKNTVLLLSSLALLLSDLLFSPEGSIREDLLSMGVVLLILFPIYLAGAIAAGDVKLLALTAMYTHLADFAPVAAGAAVASFILAVILSTVRHEPLSKTKYPFAFALLLGAIPFWHI